MFVSPIAQSNDDQETTPSVPKYRSLEDWFRPGENDGIYITAPSMNQYPHRLLPPSEDLKFSVRPSPAGSPLLLHAPRSQALPGPGPLLLLSAPRPRSSSPAAAIQGRPAAAIQGRPAAAIQGCQGGSSSPRRSTRQQQSQVPDPDLAAAIPGPQGLLPILLLLGVLLLLQQQQQQSLESY